MQKLQLFENKIRYAILNDEQSVLDDNIKDGIISFLVQYSGDIVKALASVAKCEVLSTEYAIVYTPYKNFFDVTSKKEIIRYSFDSVTFYIDDNAMQTKVEPTKEPTKAPTEVTKEQSTKEPTINETTAQTKEQSTKAPTINETTAQTKEPTINEATKEVLTEEIETEKKRNFNYKKEVGVLNVPETGKGTLVGVIDSGIDYFHEEFLDSDGKTRIKYIYDLSEVGEGYKNLSQGRVYTEEEINKSLQTGIRLSHNDVIGHGTAVTSIACGNTGVATKAGILVVKLPDKNKTAFDVLRGLYFLYEISRELKLPISINLSVGSNDSSHSGSTLVEEVIASFLDFSGFGFCVASGNEGVAGHHKIVRSSEMVEVVSSVRNFFVNIYVHKGDNIKFTIYFNDGTSSEVFTSNNTIKVMSNDICNYRVTYSYEEYDVYNQFELKFEYKELKSIVTSIYIEAKNLKNIVHMYLPTFESVSEMTYFADGSINNTLTFPSCRKNLTTVGGISDRENYIAPFSGRGYNTIGEVKPNVVAPSVNIRAAYDGDYDEFTGTSFATPIVTGIKSLMLEKNKTLTSNEMRKTLQNNAKQLASTEVPSREFGYGLVYYNAEVQNTYVTIMSKEISPTVLNLINSSVGDVIVSDGDVFGYNIYKINYKSYNLVVNLLNEQKVKFEKSKMLIFSDVLENEEKIKEEHDKLFNDETSEVEKVNDIQPTDLEETDSELYNEETSKKDKNNIEKTSNNDTKNVIYEKTSDKDENNIKDECSGKCKEECEEGTLHLSDIVDLIDNMRPTVMTDPIDPPKLEEQPNELQTEDSITSTGANVLVEKYGVTGEGVFQGFIETGINISLDVFKDGDKSKVYEIFDISKNVIIGNEEISKEMDNYNFSLADEHCNNVASLTQEFAPNSKILLAKISEASVGDKKSSFVDENVLCYSSIDLLKGLQYLVSKKELVSICMTFQSFEYGDSYFNDSIFMTILESLYRKKGVIISSPTGNNANTKKHTTINLIKDTLGTSVFELDDKVSLLSIFVKKHQQMIIRLKAPNEEVIEYKITKSEIYNYSSDNISVQITSNYNNGIAIECGIKTNVSGLWRLDLLLLSKNDVAEVYLPVNGLSSATTRFVTASVEGTITFLSNTTSVIKIGGYDYPKESLYINSGIGTYDTPIIPDVVAPAVDVKCQGNTGEVTRSGTSMATASSAGIATLMLQYNKNESTKTAKSKMQIQAIRVPTAYYPSLFIGYGKLYITKL